MAGAMLYMKIYMQPKLEADLVKQMEVLEKQRLAEFRANQTEFSASGEDELELGASHLSSLRKDPDVRDENANSVQHFYERNIL